MLKNSDRLKSGQSFCFFIKKIIKCSNRASDTDDSKDGSPSPMPTQMVSEDQTDADGHADVEQIEAVLCKSSAFCEWYQQLPVRYRLPDLE